ncbi:MAG: DUF3667 domain-containing protein [Cyclobacteriaceae bacterium]
MKKRRKHSKCLNCGQNLHESHNYCSNCGQENTDNELSIGLLFREFLSNFLSLDSRFGRTLKPFLFKPGKITDSFNEGMRVFYAHPIRWYLVISLIHFFFFMRVVDPSEIKGRSFVSGNSDELSSAQFDSLYYLPDSLHEEDNWPISDHYFTMIDKMNKDGDLSPSEILDSLKLNDLPFVERIVTRQIVKINHESSSSLAQYMLRQIPLAMFFVLPLYAFILKLFFWRKGLYIRHLVHALHIHSFFFFIMSIAWIMVLIFGEELNKTLTPLLALLGAVYILISFRNIYKVKWIWTIFRFFMVGTFYCIVLSFAMVAAVIVSFVFF